MNLLVLSLAAAASPAVLPQWPDAPDPAHSECPESVPVRAGQKLPNLLSGESGLAVCSSICEPLSSYAHLLQIEQHAKTLEELYQVDTERLQHDVNYWRQQAQQHNSLHRQPWFVAVTTTLLVGTLVLTYDSTRGAE